MDDANRLDDDTNRMGSRDEDLVQVLGYLHFSSGNPDPRSLQAFNRLYGWALAGGPYSTSPYAGMPAWLTIQLWLQDRLLELSNEKAAFADNDQASEVIQLVWLDVLPEYLNFHSELLHHQEPEDLFNGFMLGKAAEAVLQQGGPWKETDRIVSGALNHLNDFVGYRPVAVLENQKHLAYPHEFSRPLPLYIEGAGVAYGRYHDVVKRAIQILQDTPPDILRAASFNLDKFHELALDVRAFDFDHPVNKRPNYQFGQWDPNQIDRDGYYTRFVVQQVTLDAMLSRLRIEKTISEAELKYEAAAVLAGTILMASGVSGWGPSAHQSTDGLGTLLGPIARYRDLFYGDLITRIDEKHASRIRIESQKRRQPFGGARQHLNTELAKQRASQLEHVLLARLYGRMGSPNAARDQSEFVKVPSARILCQIDCLLTNGSQALRFHDLSEAMEIPRQVRSLIDRGIECGAIVDPWTILGFSGNFARFHGPDSAVHDHRVDELVNIVELLLGFMSRLWREAAAQNNQAICMRVSKEMRDLAEWWRQFSAHHIEELEATDPLESVDSAQTVADALQYWHQGGASNGDVRFWASRVELFDSPKAYALVIETLLERGDFTASMALISHWLSRWSEVGLNSGEVAFADIARNWLDAVQAAKRQSNGDLLSDGDRWRFIAKYFDYLEANADSLFDAPTFLLSSGSKKKRQTSEDALNWEEDGGDVSLFSAAYENVTYNDSTDDGVEGAIFEEETDSNDELQSETRRLSSLLSFQSALAMMWKQVAISPSFIREMVGPNDASTKATKDPTSAPAAEQPKTAHSGGKGELDIDESLRNLQIEALSRWCEIASRNRRGILALIDEVHNYAIPKGTSSNESMAQYDRRRLIKESLLEEAISTAVETSDARRMLLASLRTQYDQDSISEELLRDLPEEDVLAVNLYAHLLSDHRSEVTRVFAEYVHVLRGKRLLYKPLSRQGPPDEIFYVRLRRRVISHLLNWLPRRGFVWESCLLVDVARDMEHFNPIGAGAVTEFDELFQNAFKSLVQSLVRSAFAWSCGEGDDSPTARLSQNRKSKKRKTKNRESLGEGPANDESRLPDATQPNSTSPASPLPLSVAFGADPSNPRIELRSLVDMQVTEPSTEELIPVLEQLTEVLLASWLSHSRTLRLSILETIDSESKWSELQNFIEKYGRHLLTQVFLKLGNVRAILHQGVEQWLDRALTDGDSGADLDLLSEAIDRGELDQKKASQLLSVILEAIVDHYAEYRDYNSTTTQSDQGDLLYMFLDFLRLRVQYDRVSWNLKPVFWVHEVLVRARCSKTALAWRQALSDRISREADMYLRKLAELQERYAMRMPTVADRLEERFVKPMTIDRMRSLIRPAMRQLASSPTNHPHSKFFELLIQEASLLTQTPTGVGLDAPGWLLALDEEVNRCVREQRNRLHRPRTESPLPIALLSADQFAELLQKAADSRSFPKRIQ